jgi:glyoxylase-like metal-dependent hydrolase (beta-lactamase superfamily II)
MTALTRRTVLSGAVAAGAATLTPALLSPAQAAAPITGRQAPGWYRYKVGSSEVTVATDGARAFDLTPSYVVNAPIEEVRKALEAAYMPPNRMIHHYAPIVINTGGKLVVIDTGGGPGAYKQTKGELGQFVENLGAAGIDTKSIDMVVISHFHGDHVNGLLDAANKLAFPNAEVLVPEVEWKFWMDDGEMSRASAGRMAGLFKNNRRIFDALGRKVTPYGWGKEIASGILPVATTGHSIGHTSFVVSSGKSAIYVQSDVTNNPDLFARNPDWGASFDQDPNAAVATRRKVYDMLVAEKMLVQGFHYPFPGLGRVEKAGSGYRVVPAPWHPAI